MLYCRNCTWKIKAPMGNRVNLTFSHFEMEQVLSHIQVASFHRQRVQKSLLTRSEMLHPERLCALALRDGKLQLRLPLSQPTGKQGQKWGRDRTWKVNILSERWRTLFLFPQVVWSGGTCSNQLQPRHRIGSFRVGLFRGPQWFPSGMGG